MKIIYTIILSLSFAILNGQDTLKVEANKRVNFSFSFGLKYFQMVHLNSKLSQLGYQKVVPLLFSLGIGKNYRKNKINAGLDLQFCSDLGSFKTTSIFIEGYFNYIIFENAKISIAPGVDFGYQIINSQSKRINASNNFDSLFLSTGNYVHIENSSTTAGLSILTCIKRIAKKGRKLRDPNYYLRFGYKQAFKNDYWKADSNSLLNAPQDRLNSFYFELITFF